MRFFWWYRNRPRPDLDSNSGSGFSGEGNDFGPGCTPMTLIFGFWNFKRRNGFGLNMVEPLRKPQQGLVAMFVDLPENALFRVHREDGPLGTIPPGQEARFPLLLAAGSPDAVDCVVTWTDASGNARETRATVRT